METNVAQTLRVLGLEEKEVLLYYTLLRLGQGSAQTIAQRSGVKRPTVYVVLDDLIEKGLVSKGIVGKTTVFTANPPEHLERVLRVRQESLDHQKEELDRVMPNLRAAYQLASDRPVIRLFEGIEGILNLQREFVAANDEEIIGMSPLAMLGNLFSIKKPEDFANVEHIKIRIEAGVHSRSIYASETGPIFTPDFDRKLLRKSRWIPCSKLPIKNTFAAHGSLFSIVTCDKKIIGILIDHQDIADSFRAVFEAAWEAAVKYNPPRAA